MKKVFFVSLLLCIGMMLSAQMRTVGASKWDGFFKPVTIDKIQATENDRAGTGSWFFRPTAAISATTFSLRFDDVTGEFTGVQSAFLSKGGLGISYAHFVEADGEAVNNYSINGLLLMPMDGDAYVSLAVTAAIYNIHAGLGYSVIPGQSFKKNIFIPVGVQLRF